MRGALPVLIVAIGAVLAAESPATSIHTRVADAVVRELKQRLGPAASVIVADLDLSLRDNVDSSIAVMVSPQARLGAPIEFVVVGEGSGGRAMQIGRGRADVRVAVVHAQAARTMVRGQTLTAADLVEVVGSPRGAALRRLPTKRELVGATLRHDVVTGNVLTAVDAVAPPAVRAGETVQATASIGTVQVAAELTSLDNGAQGSIVRVVNRGSRRELRARVVGTGRVEVIHE